MTLDYTSFDFDTIKAEIIEKLSAEAVFQDYNFSGSNINTLIELVAGVGDLFGFYLNMTANESFIDTASLFENLNKLANLVGYKVTGYKSSVALLDLTTVLASYDLTSKDNYKITIPKFSRFTCSETTEEGHVIYFTNPDEIIYLIDTDSLTVPISAQSITIETSLIQGNPLDVGSELTFVTTGEPHQRYIIDDELQAIEDYMILTVDGVEWEHVDTLYHNVDSISKVYTTKFNKDKKVEINFGDGTFGVKPALNSELKIRYITSLGEDGNIVAGIINGTTATISEIASDGTSITLPSNYFTFTQAENSTGGANPEDEEDIRKKAPSSFRAQNRAVTKQDYKDLLEANFNEYVYKIKALKYEDIFTDTDRINERLTASEITTLKSTLIDMGFSEYEADNIIYSPKPSNKEIFYNNIYILTVPRFGDALTETLRGLIDTFLDDHKLLTINHVYLDAVFVPINITITYTKTSATTKTDTELEMFLSQEISDYFIRENRDLGELIIHSELVESLNHIDGVKTVILDIIRNDAAIGTETNANIQLANTEFPKLGTLTISI